MILLWKSPVNNCVVYVTYFKIPRFYYNIIVLVQYLSKTQYMPLTHHSNHVFLPMGTTTVKNVPYVLDWRLDQKDSALHGSYQLIIIQATSREKLFFFQMFV